MNTQFMMALHEVRNKLLIIGGLVHFHMEGGSRFKASKELEEVCRLINRMYAECLQCSKEPEGQNQETPKGEENGNSQEDQSEEDQDG